jgi:hypothetical protein
MCHFDEINFHLTRQRQKKNKGGWFLKNGCSLNGQNWAVSENFYVSKIQSSLLREVHSSEKISQILKLGQ